MAVSSPRPHRTLILLPAAAPVLDDVAAPGRSAHHPGITPAGVICGGGGNSPVGRGVRAAGPRVPASVLIRAAGGCPGIILPGVVQPGRQAPLP